MSAERRAEVLRQAAQAKRTAATKRAEATLRKLIKTGEEINFRTVATAAGVSVDFLYRHPELRARIEHLRSRQQQAPPLAKPDPGQDDRGVLVALTARLREARGEVAELKAQLAAAHGELLALRRQLPQAISSLVCVRVNDTDPGFDWPTSARVAAPSGRGLRWPSRDVQQAARVPSSQAVSLAFAEV